MLWGKRIRRRFFNPVAGFLLALFVLQASHDFVAPNLIPPLINTAEAAVSTIDPDGEGTTIQGTDTTCASAVNSTCLDDAVRSPTAPSTAGDYVQFSRNQQDNYTMGTFTGVSSVSSITVYLHHVEGNTGHQFQVSLWDATQVTQFGATQNVTIRTAAQWDTVTISGLSLTQAQLDGLRIRTTCTRPGTGSSFCRNYAMYAEVTYTQVINVTVGTTGTQQNLDAGTTNQHIGGAFSIQGTAGSRDITSITINETGTVDGQNNLDNIRLYYKYDTSNPYDCSGETFSGSTQYGAITDTDGFSGANGSSAFTATGISISTTQSLCVFVALDVLSTAGAGETIEVQITAPQTDVVGSGSPVITPATAVAISGATTIQKTLLTQENYHWRNDNGNETGATSATGGSENTAYSTLPKNIVKRLRFAISNEGNKTSAATQYRLEFASKVTTCAAIPVNDPSWTDVGAGGGDFDMSNTGNFADGDNTSDIAVASGGVSDPNTTFLSPNAGMKDTSSQTGNITLTSTQYVDIEYAIVASTGVADGSAYCFRVTNAGTPLDTYTRFAEATVAADISVTSSGSLTGSVTVPQTDQYAGGMFIIDDVLGASNSVTSIKIKAAGTVDAQNKLTNVRLRYDLDTSAPYDCVGETHSGGETQFGSGSFNASKEATITGSELVTGTQTMCVYVVYAASSTISNGETLTLSINNASTDVIVGSASVSPNAAVNMTGTTVFNAPYVKQTGYHWRNNDSTEAAATSATGGAENTAFLNISKQTNYRLRLGVANTGGASAASATYRLEWAQKLSTCSAATGWTRADTGSDAWEIVANGNLTDGSNTTNIAVSTGGVTDGAATFVASNGGQKDANDQTASVVIPDADFLELEYSLQATALAVQGATYCFRVTNAGTPLVQYDNYAEANIKLDTDFKVQRDFETMTGATLTLTAGVDYDAPAASSSAFIRITDTQLTGAGPNTGAGNSNADNVTVYITNPENILTSVTFQRAAFPTGNTRISWEIIEYKGVAGGENEFIVRDHAPLTYVSGNTTVNGSTVPNVVDDADMAVFITSQYNADAGRNAYNLGLSTSAWNSGSDTVTLTRGGTGAVSTASYAAIEFTGSNWKVQRSEKTYSQTAGTVETNAITAVNSLSRTFVHAQKRTSQTAHADYGHEVWLSGIGQVSFALDGQAATVSGHTSVAWIIENTQTQGLRMNVTRTNSTFNTTGTSPQSNLISISLSDLTIASIFANNRSGGTGRSWPEPFMGARIVSTTQFELWRSDINENIAYRVEIVEWPTAAHKIEQSYYRLYVDNNALTPTDPWPAGGSNLGENTEMTANDGPVANGDEVRIRMTLAISGAALPATLDSFDLQYAQRDSSCSAVTTWHSIGDSSSTTALWRGVANTPVDGTALSGDPPTGGDLLISVATVAGTYEENNPTALNPFTAFPGDEVEYDWVVQHNGAADKSSYCFRMIDSEGGEFENYVNYPVIRTVGYEPLVTDWRWYDDETNATPVTALSGAAENVAPSNVANQNAAKLRMVLRESSGANGVNIKFALQYSEYADFSQQVHTLTSTSTCAGNSLWCYYNGAGADNAVISSKVISSADSCSGGVGIGCGTYNEGTSTANATFDHIAYADTEYEFTVLHAGARSNAVYYFRLYNITYDEVVGVAPTYSYPSVVTEGAAMTSSLGAVGTGFSVAGVTTDVTTTPNTISFGSIPLDTNFEAAQQISINTNATEGYQVLAYSRQEMLNTYGDEIPPVTTTNSSPAGWLTGCPGAATGCFGYHTTDATLGGGSGRFSATDSYAALDSVPREIMYSSIPSNDVEYIVFRVNVTTGQPSGDYETDIVYLAVPVH